MSYLYFRRTSPVRSVAFDDPNLKMNILADIRNRKYFRVPDGMRILREWCYRRSEFREYKKAREFSTPRIEK